MIERNVELTRQHFDNRANNNPDPYSISGAYTKDNFHNAAEWYMQLLDVKPNDRVLEVGCGNGLLISQLAKISKYTYGCDISPEMLRKAKENNDQTHFFLSEADVLPFENAYFDKLLCVSTFHYFPSEEYATRAIAEFKRIVKPGGKMLIARSCYKYSDRYWQMCFGKPLRGEVMGFYRFLFVWLKSFLSIWKRKILKRKDSNPQWFFVNLNKYFHKDEIVEKNNISFTALLINDK